MGTQTKQVSMTAQARATNIRNLNDRLRTEHRGGRMLITPGILSLPPAVVDNVMLAIKEFEAFTADNDPYGEHDFGSIEVDGNRVFWKIDYYNPTLTAGSDDPADEDITTRVIIVMLAEEY